jgi:hypothetical protein
VPKGYKRPVADPSERSPSSDYYAEGGAGKVTDTEFIAIAHSHLLTPDLARDTLKPSEVVTDKEYNAVWEYQDGSSGMQGAIIGKPGAHHTPERIAQDQAFANDFNNVLQRNSLDNDTVLHRGMGKSMEGKLKEAGVGGVVKTDRFVSTATDKSNSLNFGEARMVINAPAGTPGAFLSRITNGHKGQDYGKRRDGIPGGGESEFVMPPGIKFRVDAISTTTKRDRSSGNIYEVPLFNITIVP